ncbi:hypothetical protein As57867_012256, partial [Aphanomyces stellatus]
MQNIYLSTETLLENIYFYVPTDHNGIWPSDLAPMRRFLAAASLASVALAAAPLCPATYGVLSADASSCTCKPGFSGLGCGQCSADSSCTASMANTRCATSFDFTADMKSKTYSCVLSAALQALFSDGMLGFTCDVAAKSCVMAVYKGATGPQGPHAVDCDLTACTFSGSTISCASNACLCTDACSAVAKSLFEVSMANKPLVVKATGNATFQVDIQGSPLPLEGTCSASSCELQSVLNQLNNVTSVNEPPKSYSKALILALAAVVVLLGGISLALVLFYTSYVAHLRHSQPKDVATELEDPLHAYVAHTSTYDRFSFQAIGCVARTPKTAATQLAKLRGRPAPTPVPMDEPKSILQGIHGSVRRGQMLALMGPSGSGKTTLLNCLAGVANGTTEFTGRVLLNGAPLPRNFRQVAAYVHQDDCLLATLTVRESIEYSAFLRLPSSMTLVAKQQLVTRVLAELHLTHVADSRIGNASLRGVSGGERRRVSIGMELVTQPQMLFLDEPTSGLDSASANSLISLLSTVAKSGRMVVLSVHQPSTKAFMKLDHVILLAKGKTMYSGPGTHAATHFASLGLPCPENENIADHLLDCATDSAHMDILHDAWLASKDPSAEQPHAAVPLPDSPASSEKGDDSPDRTRCSSLLELQVLFVRTMRTTVRQKSLFLLHVALAIFLGVAAGVCFMGLQANLAGFQNRMGAFYFILTFFGFSTLSSMDVFIQERALFLKETGAAYYGAWSYYLAKASLDLVSLRIVPAILFSSIFYYLMGLNPPADRFLLFGSTLVLYNVAAGSLSILLSIVSKTVGIANLLATVVLLVMVLFGGFLLNVQTMPAGVAWIQWLSLFKYAFE